MILPFCVSTSAQGAGSYIFSESPGRELARTIDGVAALRRQSSRPNLKQQEIRYVGLYGHGREAT